MKSNSKDALSIVIPSNNEEKNIEILASEIETVMKSLTIYWECIWVDDGSTDNTWQEIKKLKKPHKGLKLSIKSGQSTAIMAGVDYSKYELIATMDSDLQNNPIDLIPMLKIFQNSNRNIIVVGNRYKRKDHNLTRRIPSKIANLLAVKLFGSVVSDLGCSIRIFPKRYLNSIRLSGEMHRVLPLYFTFAGLPIEEIKVNHRERKFGKSKYSLNRSIKFILDVILAKTYFLVLRKPLYLFGTLAIITQILSAICFFSAIILKFIGFKSYIDSTLTIGALIIFTLSIIFVCFGLLSELLLRSSNIANSKNQYVIQDLT